MWRFRRKARFVYPIAPAPRTAVLSAAFRSRGAVRVFDDLAAVPAFEPQAVAGTLAQVESLAGMVNLTHAIIIFQSESDPRLNDAELDRLWLAFHVPVFEQIIASDGTLCAWECEAHQGLHLAPGFDPGGRLVDATPCVCGRPGARLISPDTAKVQSAAAGRP
jgi:hypothetical protein